MKYFSDRQIQRAKTARRLSWILMFPSERDLKWFCSRPQMKNNPVVANDVDLANKIFGPDVAALKGKTKRQHPLPVIEDLVEIPHELMEAQYNVTLR